MWDCLWLQPHATLAPKIVLVRSTYCAHDGRPFLTEFAERFVPNSAEVAAEVIDAEAILINLSTGNYYSMIGVGTLIWSLIDQRWTAVEIVSLLVSRYGLTPAQARLDVANLLEQLVAERLVLPASGLAPAALEDTPPPTPEVYATPQLEIFRDMRLMFALDPPMPSLKDVTW